MKSRSGAVLGLLTVLSLGCGGHSTSVTGTQASRVTGIVVSAVSSKSPSAPSAASPLAGIRVSLAGGGQSATTDRRGRFALDDMPAGATQLLFDQGARGSVSIDLTQGMEVNVAVIVSGQSATILCQSQKPLGDTNAANA